MGTQSMKLKKITVVILAKNEIFIGWLQENYYLVGEGLTFGGEGIKVLQEEFFLVKGISKFPAAGVIPHPPVEKILFRILFYLNK